MLVANIESIAVAGETTNPKRVVIAHRDDAGKVFTVVISVRNVFVYGIEARRESRADGAVFHLPSGRYVALVEGEGLHVRRHGEHAARAAKLA